MATFETGYAAPIGATTAHASTITYPQEANRIRPEPNSPMVLSALADAANVYASAAAAFISARDNLNEARERFNNFRDQVAKVQEQEGV